jgi:hypothetical protein
MATRSRIGFVRDDGKVVSIYCHSDGYLAWNGRILLEHYHQLEKVKSLIALGYLSGLDHNVEDCTHINEDEPLVCSKFEYDQLDGWEEFYYLFDDGVWKVREVYNGNYTRPFTLAECK